MSTLYKHTGSKRVEGLMGGVNEPRPKVVKVTSVHFHIPLTSEAVSSLALCKQERRNERMGHMGGVHEPRPEVVKITFICFHIPLARTQGQGHTSLG